MFYTGIDAFCWVRPFEGSWLCRFSLSGWSWVAGSWFFLLENIEADVQVKDENDSTEVVTMVLGFVQVAFESRKGTF